MMTEHLALNGIMVFVPKVHRDYRGFFSETYNARALAAAGIATDFVQDNHSASLNTGVVRGLHFQIAPHAQGKLVRVTRGSILDIAVDVRLGSPTYGQHVAVEVSAANWRQIWIPEGFAHGFCTLESNTEVLYKVTDYYAPDCGRGLAWDDPALGIQWPVKREAAILADKDKRYPTLAELPAYFRYTNTPV